MRARRGVGVALLAGLGCTADVAMAPDQRPALVVQGVLNPRIGQQLILLEQSRPQAADTAVVRFDPADPIVTAGETPVAGARVVVYGPAGDSAVAIEDRTTRSDHLGAGVYRIWTDPALGPAGSPKGAYLALGEGKRYRLRVTSTLGNAEGSTLVPSGSTPTGTTRTLNVDHDTLAFVTSAVRGAGFLYRMQNAQPVPFLDGGLEQYRRVVEGRLIAPSERDDWAFAFARDHLVPGTLQTVNVVAVDSNYLAFFAAGLDPFDPSRGRTLEGAAGVFGSAVVVYTRTLDLVADTDRPVEGRWLRDGGAADVTRELRLYARPIAGTDALRITGSAFGPSGTRGVVDGVIEPDGAMSLTVYDPRSTTSVIAANLNGELSGGVMTLRTQAGALVVYRRP